MNTVQLDLIKTPSLPIQEPNQAEYIQVALAALAATQQPVTYIPAEVTPLNRSDSLAAYATGMVVDQEMLGDPQFLDSASPEDCLSVLKYLHESGIDLKEKLKSIFDKMIKKGDSYVEVLRLLIEKYHIDVNGIKNENGETALVTLCQLQNPQKSLIALLVEKGADIYAKSVRQRRPILQVMCDKKNKGVVALLLKKSEEYAAKFIEGYNTKFRVGHINGIKSKKEIVFDRGEGHVEATRFSTELNRLFPHNFSKTLSEEHRKCLAQAFRDAASLSLKVNDETVAAVKRGDLVMMPLGNDGHSIYLVFCNGYLAICNRGKGRPEDTKMLAAYKIDISKFSLKILQVLLTLKGSAEPTVFDHLYTHLTRKLSATKDEVCKQLEEVLAPKKKQKIDNCTYTSAKLGLRAAAGMLHIQNGRLDLSDLRNSLSFSKSFSTHLRFCSIDNYFRFHEKNPELNLLDPTFSKELFLLIDRHKGNSDLSFSACYPSLSKAKEDWDIL